MTIFNTISTQKMMPSLKRLRMNTKQFLRSICKPREGQQQKYHLLDKCHLVRILCSNILIVFSTINILVEKEEENFDDDCDTISLEVDKDQRIRPPSSQPAPGIAYDFLQADQLLRLLTSPRMAPAAPATSVSSVTSTQDQVSLMVTGMLRISGSVAVASADGDTRDRLKRRKSRKRERNLTFPPARR